MRGHVRPGQIPFFAVLMLCAAVCSGETYPLIYFGNVLLADAGEGSLRRVGTLSAAASAVAADPAGRIWGRVDPNAIAALDPLSGKVTARVSLPTTARAHLITPQGKAYITHSVLTKNGFSLSVVDTRRGTLLRTLDRIDGLRTDLVQADGYVFLAGVGVRREDDKHLYLYRIDTQTDELREVRHFTEPGYTCRLAASGKRLYVACLPGYGSTALARVEALEADTLRPLGAWRQGAGEPVPRGLYAAPGEVLLFCETRDGGHELRVLDPRLETIRATLPLISPVARVLGLQGRTLLYVDLPFELGYREVNLRFYDLGAGKEVKSISIPGFLERNE